MMYNVYCVTTYITTMWLTMLTATQNAGLTVSDVVNRMAPMAKTKRTTRKPPTRGTTAPRRERVQAVTLKLPVAYLHILGAELTAYASRRGAFLTLLLQASSVTDPDAQLRRQQP
jgi:hypothetical protein